MWIISSHPVFSVTPHISNLSRMLYYLDIVLFYLLVYFWTISTKVLMYMKNWNTTGTSSSADYIFGYFMFLCPESDYLLCIKLQDTSFSFSNQIRVKYIHIHFWKCGFRSKLFVASTYHSRVGLFFPVCQTFRTKDSLTCLHTSQ